MNVPLLRRVRFRLGSKDLAVGPETRGCAVRYPVQGDGLEDGVERRFVVRPVHEFLADPREQSDWAAGQHEADGARSCGVLHGVGAAGLHKLAAALDAFLLESADGAFQLCRVRRRHGRRVEVRGFAVQGLRCQDACDSCAHVAALDDVCWEAEFAGDQAVHDPCGIVEREVPVERRSRGERVARQAGDDQVVRQLVCGLISGAKHFEHGQEFQETAGPAVQKYYRDCIAALRE